jgi:hypothetical protein
MRMMSPAQTAGSTHSRGPADGTALSTTTPAGTRPKGLPVHLNGRATTGERRSSAGYTTAVEPLPEVRVGADRLAAVTGVDVLDTLDALAELATAIVPSCVAVSLTVMVDGDAFTLTCTAADGAVLDATQYLDGGPCVDTARTGDQRSVPDVLDESRWQTYGRAAAVLGIRSSLSLPTGSADGQMPGAVNLYATDPDAFRDCGVLLAAALQVPAEHLVTNADLSFMTRDFARELPNQLTTKERVDQAVGMLMAVHGWKADESRGRLHTAAARAGTPLDKVAELILTIYRN